MAGAFLEDDIDAMLNTSEFAHVVTGAPGGAYNAILDRPTADAFGNALSGDSFALTYKVADDPALKRGDVRTVNSVSYKVHEAPRVLDDGAMAVAILETV